VGKHWNDFIFEVTSTPAFQQISDGRYFATPLNSFAIRHGAESVSEILSRSSPFFAMPLLATPGPCIPKATGCGFGPNWDGWQSRSQSPAWRLSFDGFSHYKKERTNAIDSPHLSPLSFSRFTELSMFQDTASAQ